MQICLILVLALAGSISCQDGAEQNAAPEPYSYGYETDTHSAAEQKDPSGTVTGFYTIQDSDGRQRRVEYVADAGGFRAKVATNELGTSSQNSADVQLLATPPNPEQLVAYQQAPQQQVYQAQRQQVVGYQQPQVGTTSSTQRVVNQQYYQQQQPQLAGYNYGSTNYGYYPGVAYGGYSANRVANSGYYTTTGTYPYGYNNGQYLAGQYAAGYPTGYASNNAGYYSYNNHLPSQYYRSIQTTGGVQQAGGARFVSQPVGGASYQTYRSSSQVLPATYSASSSSGQTRSNNLTGSSNYIVLKKRESEEKQQSN